MSLRINDITPDFQPETTVGPISLHDWVGDAGARPAGPYQPLGPMRSRAYRYFW